MAGQMEICCGEICPTACSRDTKKLFQGEKLYSAAERHRIRDDILYYEKCDETDLLLEAKTVPVPC